MFLLFVRLPLFFLGLSLFVIPLGHLAIGSRDPWRLVAYGVCMAVGLALLLLAVRPRRQALSSGTSTSISKTYPRGWGDDTGYAPSGCRSCGGTGKVWGEFGMKKCLHM